MPDQSSNQMMMPLNVAPGQNVKPSRVVKLSALGDFCVQHAVAADKPFGIAQNWTHGAPGTPFNDGFVSTPDNPAVMVWGPYSIAVAGLKASGTGAYSAGTPVGADVNSELVAIAAGWAVGWLLESGAANKQNKLRVFVFPHFVG